MRNRAFRNLLAIAEDVLGGEEGLEVWRENLVKTWREDPWTVWKWLIQVAPKESLTFTRGEAGHFATYTVEQLKRIAGVEEGPLIDVEAEDASD